QFYNDLIFEFKKAMPQFHENVKEGTMELNNFEEIMISYLKDRWLIGNLVIEKFLQGEIKSWQTYKVLEAIETNNLQKEAVAQTLTSSKLVDQQIFSKQIFLKLLCLIILLSSIYVGFSNLQK